MDVNWNCQLHKISQTAWVTVSDYLKLSAENTCASSRELPSSVTGSTSSNYVTKVT